MLVFRVRDISKRGFWRRRSARHNVMRAGVEAESPQPLYVRTVEAIRARQIMAGRRTYQGDRCLISLNWNAYQRAGEGKHRISMAGQGGKLMGAGGDRVPNVAIYQAPGVCRLHFDCSQGNQEVSSQGARHTRRFLVGGGSQDEHAVG